MFTIGFFMRLCLLIVSGICFVGVSTSIPQSPLSDSKAVLVLLPGQPGAPFTVDFLNGMRQTFRKHSNDSVQIYSEHLNFSQFPYSEYESEIVQWLSIKYSRLKFAVIVTVVRDNLEFTEKWKDVLWAKTPIVFSVVDETERKVFPSGITGINFQVDYAGTVETALKLQPQTQNLALISGTSKQDLFNREYVLKQLKPLEKRLKIIEIAGLSFTETTKRLSTLPKNTIVLSSGFFVDGLGQIYFAREYFPKFVAASNSPIYEVNELTLGLGVVGGQMNDYEVAGVETAEMVLRVLNGESLSNIPVGQSKTPRLMFDWRQLKKWGIDESMIPAGSTVVFRSPTFWEEYKWHISGALGLIVVQALLIAALLAERTMRRTAQESERKTIELSHSVLNSVQEQVGIIDKNGMVISVNDSWSRFSSEAKNSLMGTEIGKNYVQNCEKASEFDESAKKALDGIRSVLKGTSSHFSMEYSSPVMGETKWYEMSVEPLKTPEGGAVVSHANITERRIAEMEAQERRRELAHVSRAVSMGELASSLAHELNQPLTAILSNAQAATRLMAKDTPDLEIVKEALQDVVDDDIRAGKIIHRMRSLLKKEEIRFAPVNINDVVNNVVRLTRNEALIRKVNLQTELTKELPKVMGDDVQLQQVVLNLVINALESSSLQQQGERYVEAFTMRNGFEVQLMISDSGTGIPPEKLPQIFEPFFTTKKEGLGMGLSICRSIVMEHGGRIWAESLDKGAKFYCAFPAIPQSETSV